MLSHKLSSLDVFKFEINWLETIYQYYGEYSKEHGISEANRGIVINPQAFRRNKIRFLNLNY